MYGSIARITVKPGMSAALQEWAEAQMGEDRRSAFPPPVAFMVYQMDHDPNEMWMVIAANNREEYRANAESPESHERFLQMMEFLAKEPDWHDGEVIRADFG